MIKIYVYTWECKQKQKEEKSLCTKRDIQTNCRLELGSQRVQNQRCVYAIAYIESY